MRITAINLVAATCLAAQLRAQDLVIPYTSAPATIDGKLEEWKNAATVVINIERGQNIPVYAMHDSSNLYLAFKGPFSDGSGMPLFPEVMIDPKLAKAKKWEPGIWWFHISKTDCEHNGAYGAYDNCTADHSDWHAHPNFGSPETIEILIPFSKVGIDLTQNNKLGLSLLVTNTFSIWKEWPAGADHNLPASWATVILGNKM